MSLRWIAALLLVIGTGAAAQDMKPPRITRAQVDWDAVATTLAGITPLQPAQASAGFATANLDATAQPNAVATTKLMQLNTATTRLFPKISASAVPVLLPFDANALLRERPSGQITAEARARYLSGFGTLMFFLAGPAGYDAAFEIKLKEIPDLADIKYKAPVEVHISGAALVYELDEQKPLIGKPVPEFEDKFPGILRFLHESHVRYTFVRYGVPYVVSILCFDGGRPRFKKPTCRSADRIATHFLRALHIAGGTPQRASAASAPAIERPENISPTFTYHSPGWLLPGTGFRGHSGNPDRTRYSQIRFPVAKAPTFINSHTFQSRNRRRDPDSKTSPNYDYPWRDNFCERRSFFVGQCPAGYGHQGQDIRPPLCEPDPGEHSCKRLSFVVAARDGVIMRAPKQEALYVVVNNAAERIRFRYLHMSPHQLDADGWLSGRIVREGEFLGEVGNFSKRVGGTSYHLHFDIEVPTKHGWVFVNPYMTLVAAYERLIRARGTEVRRAEADSPESDKVAATDSNQRTGAKHDRRKFRRKYSTRCKSKRLSWRARKRLCGAGAWSRTSAKPANRVRKVGRGVSRNSYR